MILAWDYMVRVADVPDGAEPLFLGLAGAELKNGLIAFVLIVSARALMVLISDDETRGRQAVVGRLVARVVLVGLIAFSIWTAAAETATKLQGQVDQTETVEADKTTASDIAATASNMLGDAQKMQRNARDDLRTAQDQARTAREAFAEHDRKSRVQFAGDSDALGWALNADRGLARPYRDAVVTADAAVIAAQNRLTAADRAVLECLPIRLSHGIPKTLIF